jgi:probable rRNA maturation factor
VRITIAGEAPCDLAPVRRAMRRAARQYGLPKDAEVHLAFVSDAVMKEMNGRFRKIDRTTDVLSFGEALPAGAKGTGAVPHIAARRPHHGGRFDLGEILISAEQAAKQARRRRKPVVEEVAFLAAHGTLHLLGFEDETPAGYREMVRLGREAVATSAARRSSGAADRTSRRASAARARRKARPR